MNNSMTKLFSRELSAFEEDFHQISKDFPELKSHMDELLYPMKFLNRLWNEAQDALNNEVGSIEQMRFIIGPSLVEGQEIRDAVNELLPAAESCDAPTLTQLSVDKSLIHFGALLVTLLAAGRAGMKPFNLADSSNEFIDIVKYNALATIPMQELANILKENRPIDSFIDSFLHQANNYDSFTFLKTMILTFWSSDGLATARRIEEVTKLAKDFFANVDDLDEWNGKNSIQIIRSEFLHTCEGAEYPINIETDYSAEKIPLALYFMFKKIDNTGYVSRLRDLSTKNYAKKSNSNTFRFDDFNHQSGWLHIQTETEREDLNCFAENLLNHWKSINESENLFSDWPIPLDCFPLNESNAILPPIINRKSSNHWGPEIVSISHSVLLDENDSPAVELKVEISQSSVAPTFEVMNFLSPSSHTFAIDQSIEKNIATIRFSSDELRKADRFIEVFLYIKQNREEFYDAKRTDLNDWQAQVDQLTDTTDSDTTTHTPSPTTSPSQGNTPSRTTAPTPSAGNGDGGQQGEYDDQQTIPLVFVLPGILTPTSEDERSVTNMARVYQVSQEQVNDSIYTLYQSTPFSFTRVHLPLIKDQETDLNVEDLNLSEENFDSLLSQLSYLSANTKGAENAIWISLVESETSHYVTGSSTGASGLIVTTSDSIVEAFNTVINQKNEQKIAGKLSSAISISAQIKNGALSENSSVVSFQMRQLDNSSANTPSQWVAYGYTNDMQILFEERINISSDIYSGPVAIDLPFYQKLNRIELRYQPELYAIEIASVTQPRVAEAAIKLLPNESILRGSTFRRFTPRPAKELIVFQRKAGELFLTNVLLDINSNRLNWQASHSSGITTHSFVSLTNNEGIERVYQNLPANTSYMDLSSISVDTHQAQILESINVLVSDGWNVKSSQLSPENIQERITVRNLVPRLANHSRSIYWIDTSGFENLIPDFTQVYWKVGEHRLFDSEEIFINQAVHLNEDIDPSEVTIELIDNYVE